VADTGLTHDDWLERVPQLLSECVEEWGLRLGEPYAQGAAGYTVRAERDGAACVLKLIYPHREAEQEAEAVAASAAEGPGPVLSGSLATGALVARQGDQRNDRHRRHGQVRRQVERHVAALRERRGQQRRG